jgi:hypothetical protein
VANVELEHHDVRTQGRFGGRRHHLFGRTQERQVILVIGIAVLVAMLGVSVGLAVCASVVARRSDDMLDLEIVNALEPPHLADEPALTTRRFARDPAGRPIAAPHAEPPRRASVAHR